jgi:hypothetical protein
MLKETLIYNARPRKQLLRLKKRDVMIKWTSSASRDRVDHYKIICIISAVCLLVNVEPRKDLPNLVNDVVPRNPIFCDGTLPYRSMDCLKF